MRVFSYYMRCLFSAYQVEDISVKEESWRQVRAHLLESVSMLSLNNYCQILCQVRERPVCVL